MNTTIPKTRPGQLRRAMRHVHEAQVMLYALETDTDNPRLEYSTQRMALKIAFSVLQLDYQVLTGRTYQP